jgi:hypothetical protein
MRQVEFWRWAYTDPETGARKRTTYRMSREDAEQRFPGAEPIEGTREVRNLPDGPEEWDSAGAARGGSEQLGARRRE